MIKLDLAYLQVSIHNSKHDFCEAGSVKSVNRRLGGGSSSKNVATRKNDGVSDSESAFKANLQSCKTLPRV